MGALASVRGELEPMIMLRKGPEHVNRFPRLRHKPGLQTVSVAAEILTQPQ